MARHLLPTILLASLSSLASAGVQDAPWVPLFDGESLDGWVTKGGRYDGNAVWTVEEGAITGREGPNSAGGLIYTEKMYKDFEVELDCWITYPFDSGIFLRMVPRDLAPADGGGKGAQVTLDYREGGEIGGIYADGYLFHNTWGKGHYHRDKWNRLKVRCVGEPMQLTVWMNGVVITDYTCPAHGKGAFAPSGRIGLQVHGARAEPESSVVRFKNVRVREFAPGEGSLLRSGEGGALEMTSSAREAGWESLFNGRDMSGWHGADEGAGYEVRNGELAFLAKGSSPHLITEADYTDFDLRFDFKIGDMANSGLFLRGPRSGGDPAWEACEVQILDDHNWEAVTKSKLLPYQFCGGLYGSVAPAVKDALRPNGEWNTYQVHYVGSRLQVKLNGHQLFDVDTDSVEVPKGQKPFADRSQKGFIGLQRHAPGGALKGDAYAWFRNIYIRPYDSSAEPAPTPAEAPASQGGPGPSGVAGPEHQVLHAFAGTWDATARMGTSGESTYAEESGRMALNGLWLIFDYRGEFFGQPFEGHGLMGFDQQKQRYVTTWVDSMNPTPVQMDGDWDAAGRKLTFSHEVVDPVTGETVIERHEHVFRGDGRKRFEMIWARPDGDEVALQIDYVRRKD